MKCDRDGVPDLIQRMTYSYDEMSFEVLLFNGKILYFSTDFACPSIDLLQESPTRMQYLEAENKITKELTANFQRY